MPILLTPTEIIEYLYCPRFIYYMNCLNIPQREEKRFKVQRGRSIHLEKQNTNKEYLRKKIGVIKKETEVYLSSEKHSLKGVVDEVLTLKDGTMAPLDYKFAEYKEKNFRTHVFQSLIYGLLIEENYGKTVEKGFIVYTRSRNKVEEILYREKDYEKLREIIEEMKLIIEKGFYPAKTKDRIKCMDCTYNRICV